MHVYIYIYIKNVHIRMCTQTLIPTDIPTKSGHVSNQKAAAYCRGLHISTNMSWSNIHTMQI